MCPADGAALDDRAGETSKRGNRRDLARQVKLVLRRARGLAGIARGQPQAGEPNRQIDEEDEAPADQRDQAAADEGTSGQRQTCARRPDADGAAARLVVGIGMAEQREGIRDQNCRAEPLSTLQ